MFNKTKNLVVFLLMLLFGGTRILSFLRCCQWQRRLQHCSRYPNIFQPPRNLRDVAAPVNYVVLSAIIRYVCIRLIQKSPALPKFYSFHLFIKDVRTNSLGLKTRDSQRHNFELHLYELKTIVLSLSLGFCSCCCCCCLPDPFRGMGAWRKTMEPQKPGNSPGSGPEVIKRQRVAKE